MAWPYQYLSDPTLLSCGWSLSSRSTTKLRGSTICLACMLAAQTCSMACNMYRRRRAFAGRVVPGRHAAHSRQPHNVGCRSQVSESGAQSTGTRIWHQDHALHVI